MGGSGSMSAVPISSDQALPLPAASAKRNRSIRLTRGHLVAVLLATLVTSVVDFSFLFDKLAKPGIWKIFAFEPVTSLLIYGFALLAWLIVATEQSERTRWGQLVVASILSAAAATAARLASVHRRHGAAFTFRLFVYRCRSEHSSTLDNAAGGISGSACASEH